jgi:hypothetical protein
MLGELTSSVDRVGGSQNIHLHSMMGLVGSVSE